jgi:hypothetical protein
VFEKCSLCIEQHEWFFSVRIDQKFFDELNRVAPVREHVLSTHRRSLFLIRAEIIQQGGCKIARPAIYTNNLRESQKCIAH